MAPSNPDDIDRATAPFDRFTSVRRLGADRRGRDSTEHARYQLYVGRDRETRLNFLIKLTTRPGKVYQHDLENEIATLSTINRELPHSRYFPVIDDHGQSRDGRAYLVSTLFEELPLAASIGTEWVPERLVAHLRTALEIAKAATALHGLQIFHVDLNPMNILYRTERSRPIIRIVDFESSYEVSRHTSGVFYSPPTTTGYSAPEVSQQPPDARSDVFSLGAVLHTMLEGYKWPATGGPRTRVESDPNLDAELRDILLGAVAPSPDGRYASAAEFAGRLAGYLERIWPGRTW
jgi:serine/threonine protein kinase